ncbi:PHD finger protein 20 isoform X2 [Ceratina calcarata]|uniref:PHD finger protein 20 isoform X2 n=1 Tax=Ceratina calcarata TaxID=156304 RepID=A0AAJ7ITF6_9HYME|nr:PHD finger protein 20 isoform X2 [Ceratina calcarata]
MRRRIPRSHVKRMPPTGAMRMARKCCVRNCEADVQDARARGLPLHKFPKDTGLRNKWLASGGFDESFKPSPAQFICHRHFKRADYEAAKGQKLLLRKGSVPSVFSNYDNHPDPVIMSVKSSTSYAQEDLDLINSEILNLEQSVPQLNSDARTPKSDSCEETCSSRPESSIDSFNLLDSTDVVDNGCKTSNSKETESTAKQESEIQVNTVAVQLGIVESNDIKHTQKDLTVKEELKTIKVEEKKVFDKPEELKPKIFNRGGLKFFPGAKLEAKDFNEKWYTAKIVETDWDEREVLIRFDKWSTRFDEWIPMDSSRLRVLQTQSNEQIWNVPSPEAKMKDFSVGERILATWADGRKYPAKVNAVLGNDRYDVLFDDGYAKTIKSSKMTKIANTSTKQSSQNEDYIGSKQERRDKKRKHTVMELFHTHSRKRSKNDADKSAKKEAAPVNDNGDYFSLSDNKIDLDGTMFGACYDPGTDLLRGFDTNVSKMKTLPKKNKKEIPKVEVDQSDDVGPEWIDGEPQGTESYIVDGNDGPRRSIIVEDKRLPPGWQKHFTQRKAGTSAGKWDVLFLHKSTGKKFRSRNDIRVFMENQGQFDFDPEKFDFCIHRKKRNQNQKVKQEVVAETPKKIKTLLPKSKATPITDNSLAIPPNIPVTTLVSSSTTSITDGAVFIGGLRVEMEDSAYKCPKEGCNKTFRKENLLQMHIKHYHPEYSKFLGSTPNVADLAYARTIGESVEDIIPKKSNNLLEKCNKLGKRKSIQDKLYASSPSVASTTAPVSPTIVGPVVETEDEVDQIERCNDVQTEDIRMDRMSPTSSHSLDMDDETDKKRDDTCAMSPSTLFDMKVREEKTQSGIKTLLPVRPAVASDAQRIDRSKSLDETHIDKMKGQRKRQLSEYSSDLLNRSKKRHGIQEYTDEYGDMDDSGMDTEGPTTLMYRYSRRKSDSRSDENSQSSQLNDSRVEKDDPLKGDGKKDTVDGEDNEGVMMMINGEMVKVEQLRREEIINCTCGYMEEDGLMIQCDLCLCWQHGHCNAIEREKDVPEKYVCYICRNPYRQRQSKKYFHDQDWIKEGKLPTLPNRTKNQHRVNERTAMLKRSYDLIAALLHIQQVLHSLRVKINVAQKKDHPKLYLWAKNWEKIEVLKPSTSPVPIMEVAKSGKDFVDIPSDVDIKLETKFTLKDDPDEKSIASDSELMKILEEDNAAMDESKVTPKKEELEPQSKSHILLDALAKNDTSEGKLKNSLPSEVKMDTGLLTNESNVSENNVSTSTNHEEMNDNELSTPLQPFIPQPEAPIDPGECRMRLLEHIEDFQNHIDARLTYIEAQVCALETMDPEDLPTSDVQPRTKQTIQMLLRDLNTVRKLAALC